MILYTVQVTGLQLRDPALFNDLLLGLADLLICVNRSYIWKMIYSCMKGRITKSKCVESKVIQFLSLY